MSESQRNNIEWKKPDIRVYTKIFHFHEIQIVIKVETEITSGAKVGVVRVDHIEAWEVFCDVDVLYLDLSSAHTDI